MSLPTPRRTFLASLIVLTLSLPSVYSAFAQGLTASHAGLRAAIAAQNSVTPDLMTKPGILGTAVTVDANGAPAVVIYVDQGSKHAGALIAALQRPVAGIAVQVELTDQFRAYTKPSAGNTPGHTAPQAPPIQLGTSGGWRFDLANGYCCGGTLGSLISAGGVQYILSNYHVMEADIVPGGNNLTATTDSPVVHPGLIDVGCNADNAQNVATLRVMKSLPGSNVDVGLAKVADGMVRTDGSILGIGTISASTAPAAVGQLVKKSGRTSGLTRSTVAALNATINVTYDKECAGGAVFTKMFTGQIVISNKGSTFLRGGDSGSLMVEDVTSNARAVGLLYAGSNTSAIANPINEVLTFVGSVLKTQATMVGN
jgi:hypothetical protein